LGVVVGGLGRRGKLTSPGAGRGGQEGDDEIHPSEEKHTLQQATATSKQRVRIEEVRHDKNRNHVFMFLFM
jgi:hypothetical protein